MPKSYNLHTDSLDGVLPSSHNRAKVVMNPRLLYDLKRCYDCMLIGVYHRTTDES